MSAALSHASKVMLKILQARLQQHVNCELPDVQAGFNILIFLYLEYTHIFFLNFLEQMDSNSILSDKIHLVALPLIYIL